MLKCQFFLVCFCVVGGLMPLSGKLQLKTTSLYQQRAQMWSSHQVNQRKSTNGEFCMSEVWGWDLMVVYSEHNTSVSLSNHREVGGVGQWHRSPQQADGHRSSRDPQHHEQLVQQQNSSVCTGVQHCGVRCCLHLHTGQCNQATAVWNSEKIKPKSTDAVKRNHSTSQTVWVTADERCVC